MEFITGIQSIPLTRQNICPRMRRAARKSSIIGMFVGVIVSVVIFVLSSYINYLVSIRNEIFEGRINSIKANKKNLTSLTNNLAGANKLVMDDDINQTNKNHILLFTILLLVFLLTVLIIVILFIYMCLSKSASYSTNFKANNNNNKQGISIPIRVYTSVTTQTPWHESDFISY